MIGLALLVTAFALLTWCSTELGRANPTARLPAKMPDIQQPASYMWLGMVGITLGIAGGLVLLGPASAAGWLMAAAVIIGGLLPAQVRHNRHVR